jgi:thiosulfate/3-mercaptopyruvate sulfurtransferase
MSRPVLPTPLVSTDWLAAHLADPTVSIIDASAYLPGAGRDASAEYRDAHIPGAVFCDLGWISDETAPFPHTLPSAEQFAARMAALGVSSDSAVVVYDTSGQNFSAPRLWWMLRAFGHARVAVLDGGLGKWMHDGHPVESDVPAPAPAHFAATLEPARVRDLGAMRRNVELRDEQVVDARSPGRFEGSAPEPRAGVRSGHIPHSVNVHYARLVQDDGTMRPANELQQIVAEAGLDITRPIVASCGSGVTACAVLLALDVIGVHDTAVYDGSWTEWGSMADTPVETGPAR